MKRNSPRRPRSGSKALRPNVLSFDSLASEYDAWFEEAGRLIFAIEVSAFQEVMTVLPKPWLEVGVGSGRFAQALRIETGIDPSAKLLEMAEKRGITTFLARGEDELFDKESFGTVFLIVTLCFVESPLAVLREAHRILKARGKIALGLVLRDSSWGQFYLGKKSEGHRFYKHATFYSYREVMELVKKAGFAIERVVSTLFQKPGQVVEMETARDGLSADAGFTILVAEKITDES
jgi:ubiquinone/menaquinone biosynthesis C-methylase UbiE